jgi:predicted AlkP superfamily pyrophosphatase or phosphodiesterase
MKSKFLLFPLLAFASIGASAQVKKPAATSALPRPKLVVGIMVDQMRWDYLYRYYDRYENGGFKRMLNEGFSCDNAHINYSASVTGIGHASVYTGSVPAIHGIAGNDFIVQATGKTLYCAGDSTVQTVGSDNATVGKMSPRNLLASTMGDELRIATNFRAKVIAVASKDRGSILPGGRAANAAYWYDGSSGNWVTSTYYMKQLPDWVNKFNAQKLPEKFLKQDWNTLYPIETYVQSTKDDSPYEGKFTGTDKPTFPLKTSQLMTAEGLGLLTSTPYGSTLTLEMAKAAIANEDLGADAITDLLAISVSSTDYVGHRFGPNSIEAEDTYLRLDRDLATFFTYLDSKVGKGNYSVFLTADHGAMNNANFLIDNKIAAGLVASKAWMSTLNSQLEQDYKVKNLVTAYSNTQITLNHPAINANKLNEAEIRTKVVDFVSKQEGIAYAVDIKDLATSDIPELYRNKMMNSYNRERSGVIQVMQKQGWSGGGATGATHGTVGHYDTHIPVVFMGWGIKHGQSNAAYNMTDIAPTITSLLKIQEPNGTIGKPITEVYK